jgi:hypothetical protein
MARLSPDAGLALALAWPGTPDLALAFSLIALALAWPALTCGFGLLQRSFVDLAWLFHSAWPWPWPWPTVWLLGTDPEHNPD